MDDTLEHPKPSSNLNIPSTIDEDREQDSSGDEDGGLDWTKLPYVHLPPDSVVA
jgi:tRNA-splicing endonuclease subunit Sen54